MRAQERLRPSLPLFLRVPWSDRTPGCRGPVTDRGIELPAKKPGRGARPRLTRKASKGALWNSRQQNSPADLPVLHRFKIAGSFLAVALSCQSFFDALLLPR